MSELILTTYDWVPDMPRGHVRDIRVRWALEEAGLPYRVESTSFETRGAAHLAHQPFGQTPWLQDGDLSIFESGAILLHVGELSETLMPRDAASRSRTVQWVFAALNSMEMASVAWSIMAFSGQTSGPTWEMMNDFVKLRLSRLEPVVAQRDWLAGPFSVADIAMVEVLRLIDRLGGLAESPACKAYVERATARPAFKKAYADQMAHFARADEMRA